ncbi:MAG: cation:proton antiporter [Gemmatimonadetes bacterium]|nr:cation:proton antiporter [Gemmatimonadota bacterium]
MAPDTTIPAVVLSVMGLLLVAAATRALSRRSGVPFPIALVLVGMGLSWLGAVDLGFLQPMADLRIPPEVVFYVFLPTLVFEAAFNLDVRDLRENMGPVLTLAIPGLVLSSLVTGWILHAAAPLVGLELGWAMSLLLGSILSATDAVGLIELFRQIGAPKRLTMLVEGESLFNDATAIVLSRILLGVVLAGGATGVSFETVALAVAEFALIFAGGLAVGWGAAVLVGLLLGRVEGNAFIEISLTTVLAYLAYLVAEETLGVSGVIAALAAGLLIGGWGKAKISPSVAGYLGHHWSYLAAVANSLVFLMVGLRVEVGALVAILPILGCAIAAMLLSRALSIFVLVPLAGRLPGSDPVNPRYQVVMFWGGMRGGVALAIALALPPIPGRDTLVVPLVMGVVLFTLLVQGLTMERVVKWLELHVPPLSDRIARMEGLIAAKRRTLEQIPELQAGGLFSPRIAESVRQRCSASLEDMREALERMRDRELDIQEERRLLHLRCFAEEKILYYEMFSRGHLSERSFRNLTHSIELQTEAIRHEARLPEFTLHPPTGERLENVLHRVLDDVPGLRGLAEVLRAGRTARDYEVAWARSRGSLHVLSTLDEIAVSEAARPATMDEVRACYQYWHESARARLDQTAEQFPEFVASTQERLADRLVLHAERAAIEEKARAGIIPLGVAESMLAEMAEELRRLRASQVSKLRIAPEELLRKVPFFEGLPHEEFQQVAQRLRRRTAPAGEAIVRQGDTGDSLYLVARGVVRVSRQDGGLNRDLNTLMAGDFFGEMALLHGGRRTATCRAVTPCALYELRREDLEEVGEAHPAITEALRAADRKRRAEQRVPLGPAEPAVLD